LTSQNQQIPLVLPNFSIQILASTQNLASKETRDGNGRYVLRGFISHMGRSPHSGHYVAHVKKDGKWYLFNDEKVAISQNPPISLGYIYLFQRV
jgi:ubiquitin carboxyl-terminal hydrolase 5/13